MLEIKEKEQVIKDLESQIKEKKKENQQARKAIEDKAWEDIDDLRALNKIELS